MKCLQASCGRGDVWGDGITPLECAVLKGAENIVLDGVLHNPGTPQWYGDAQFVLPKWVPYMTESRPQSAASNKAKEVS